MQYFFLAYYIIITSSDLFFFSIYLFYNIFLFLNIIRKSKKKKNIFAIFLFRYDYTVW